MIYRIKVEGKEYNENYTFETPKEGDMFSSPPRGSLISILSLTPPKTQGFHPPFAGQTRK